MRLRHLLTTVFLACLLVGLAVQPVRAEKGLLDGRVFVGRIGPVEAPDLDDRLYFDGGHFWSGICTECGFAPGLYTAEHTDGGIAFSGVLNSDSRGQFAYRGVVAPDGTIEVSIQWSRQRWYWTARRELGFVGEATGAATTGLQSVRDRLARLDPGQNPLCARF